MKVCCKLLVESDSHGFDFCYVALGQPLVLWAFAISKFANAQPSVTPRILPTFSATGPAILVPKSLASLFKNGTEASRTDFLWERPV